MGLFKKPASAAQVRAFERGKRQPAKVAVAKATGAKARASAKKTGGNNLAAQSAAWKKQQAKRR